MARIKKNIKNNIFFSTMEQNSSCPEGTKKFFVNVGNGGMRRKHKEGLWGKTKCPGIQVKRLINIDGINRKNPRTDEPLWKYL